jgi:serine/threonine protein kinase
MTAARIGLELMGPRGEMFKLTDYLGRGAFGEVYRAIGVDSGGVLAAKLLPLEELHDEDARTALLNEVKSATQIIHPNVVRILHVMNEDSDVDEPYILMEYVSGGTLASLLRSQRSTNTNVSLDRAREMMIDIAQGARAINERLIHRDIKPDNILFDDSRLKISDFGISKVIDERTRSRTFKGGQHILYMAPEGWEAEANTYKLDVYSVGLVFYEILTLRHPLEQAVAEPRDWRAWRKAHLFADIPDPRQLRSDISLALSQLLARMIAKRPAERPAWDEVINILSSEEEVPVKSSRVSSIVEAALKLHQENQRKQLAAAEKAEREHRKIDFYRYSGEKLLESFEAIVEDFNSSFQHGRISRGGNRADVSTYMLPNGIEIICAFFPRPQTPVPFRSGRLIGGGYLGNQRSASANLLLVSYGDDDLYGQWKGCLVRFGGLATRRIIGTLGITENTIEPFGFLKADDFYNQMSVINALGAFNYEIVDDVQQLFIDILETASVNKLNR